MKTRSPWLRPLKCDYAAGVHLAVGAGLIWPLADCPLAAAFDAFLPLASAAMFERLHKVW